MEHAVWQGSSSSSSSMRIWVWISKCTVKAECFAQLSVTLAPVGRWTVKTGESLEIHTITKACLEQNRSEDPHLKSARTSTIHPTQAHTNKIINTLLKWSTVYDLLMLFLYIDFVLQLLCGLLRNCTNCFATLYFRLAKLTLPMPGA